MSESSQTDEVYKAVRRQEVCSMAAVRRIAAMLDLDPDNVKEGENLPRGWQFFLLAGDTRRSEIREDGFPGLGVPLPDLGLPRLLLGGRTVSFSTDIRIGDPLRRESRIQAISHKQGQNGPMAIVSVAHDLYQVNASHPSLSETQTYILLSAQPGSSKISEAPAASIAPGKQMTPDDVLLFQYSALGFNSHKIHIDRQYARDVEGFPDLVVNGGLSTLLLTEYFRAQHSEILSTLKARHLLPLFCGRPISMTIERTAQSSILRAYNDTGALAVEILVNA